MSDLVYRGEDFPGDNFSVTCTVTPGVPVIGEWIDLKFPRILTVSWRISGLTLPFSGNDEGLDMLVRYLIGHIDGSTPPVAPDLSVSDKSTFSAAIGQTKEDLGDGVWRLSQLLLIARWVYLSLEPWPVNANTADVLVTVTV